MTLRLNGSTSGYVELDCPAVGGDNNIKLPASNGSANNLLKNSGTAGELEFASNVNIDSSGRLLVGTSSARSDLVGLSPTLQVEGTDQSTTTIAATRNSDNSGGPALLLAKSRGTTAGAVTVVQNNDLLGGVYFMGADGTNVEIGAQITAAVDGTPGNNDLPSRLVFSTTADGASSPTERVRLSNSGNFYVYSSGNDTVVAGNAAGSGTAQSLFAGVHSRTSTTGGGTVAYRIYNNGTTFSVSDERQKKNIESTRDGYLEDLQQLRVVKYNWKDQADDEPKELGLIAQEVASVFPGLVQQADLSDPESTLGIKSSVFSFMLIKALQEAAAKIETLEAKVAALEAS